MLLYIQIKGKQQTTYPPRRYEGRKVAIMTKANIKELNTLSFEEAEKKLEELGYIQDDNVDSTDTNVADYVLDTYYHLYDEDDNELDTISFEQHYNLKNPGTEDEEMDAVLEKWERVD